MRQTLSADNICTQWFPCCHLPETAFKTSPGNLRNTLNIQLGSSHFYFLTLTCWVFRILCRVSIYVFRCNSYYRRMKLMNKTKKMLTCSSWLSCNYVGFTLPEESILEKNGLLKYFNVFRQGWLHASSFITCVQMLKRKQTNQPTNLKSYLNFQEWMPREYHQKPYSSWKTKLKCKDKFCKIKLQVGIKKFYKPDTCSLKWRSEHEVTYELTLQLHMQLPCTVTPDVRKSVTLLSDHN